MKYQIRFGAIELISKSVAAPPLEEYGLSEYLFSFSVGIDGAIESKLAMVATEISIVARSEQFASFRTLMLFEIGNFEELFKKNESDRYEIPMDLEIFLKSVAISTTRGIIYSELRGTFLQNIILPLIDITGLVKVDRAKKLEKKEE